MATTSALPPGPDTSTALLTARFFARPLPLFDECAARFGPVFTLNLLGLRKVVFVAEPELIRGVYTADEQTLGVTEGRWFLKTIVGESSVLVLDGAPHMRKRRLLLPPFHGERMNAYARVMAEAAAQSVDGWPLGRPFALLPAMQAITLRVILRAVFGIEEASAQRRLFSELTELVNAVSSPLLMAPGFFRINLFEAAPWLRPSRLKADVDALLYAEIARRRGQSGDRGDVLSLLLAARDERGEPLSDAELRDELFTVLVAGYETTATALAWTFGLLLRHPQALSRLLAELDALASADPAELSKLDYLDAVARESLRLYPVVPVVSRTTLRPFALGPFTLPPGTRVSTCIYLTHRRPDLYPDPERFRPERFLGKKPDPYAWFPFGGGLRRCIGMAFALHELKIVLATILQRASLRLPLHTPPRPVRRSVTLAPADGTVVVLDGRRSPPGGAGHRAAAGG